MSWPMVKLGDVSEPIMGQAPPGTECNKSGQGTIFVKAGEFGVKFPEVKEWTTKPLKFAKTGDTLLCVVGATCGKVNRAIDCSIGRSVAAIRPNTEVLDSSYLYYFISSWSEKLRLMSQGAAQTVINKDMINSLEIPLPPLDEQKRIAAILDKADAIRQKRKQAIALADEFLRSVFLEMFGDPVTNPKGWEVKALSEFSKVVTGNTPPRSEADNYGEHIEWIKSDNINTPSHFLTEATEKLSEKGEAKGRIVERGSILMTCIAGSLSCIGNIALANRSVAFNQQINAIVPTETSMSEFLYGLMLVSKKQIQEHSTNSMKGMISKGVLSSIKFPLPPLQEQKKYANVFRSYITFLDQMDKHAIDSVDMFNALSQKAFSGQL
ncbi:restriction endonuclease subunit S [Vibrio vulnificus]|nr:restriction endonuclease subunit S [Vibrio vulnificus]